MGERLVRDNSDRGSADYACHLEMLEGSLKRFRDFANVPNNAVQLE